ncbi:NEDD4-binding protein 2-like [Palaemon carinicauda]|uniref:NEDD4-binding protein 2-like n=1 Tax=Palaemon carinicauda TaxID=392227 RepID=UPI0035B6241A
MAATDHGELLTRFEEIFGSVVEHEVIKMVLQNCDWNSTCAKEMIMSMIDPDMLPPHVKCVVTADAIVQGGNSQRPDMPPMHNNEERLRSRSPDVQSHNHVGEQYFSEEDEEEEDDTLVAPRSRTESPSSSAVLTTDSVSGRTSRECWPSLRPGSTSLTPFAMAQGAYISSNTRRRSEPVVQNALDSEDERTEDAKATDRRGSESPSDRESDLSLPNSPFKPSAPLMDSTNETPYTARWVLAPEFVPNALHPNSRVFPLSPTGSQPFVGSFVHRLNSKESKKNEIISKIKRGEKIVVLMRGLPGSGKSSLAREIKGYSGVVLSTDDYFVDKKGRYIYEPSKISEAHSWNKNRARKMLREMKSPIIIDNTNLQAWEMKPYVQLALHNGYEIDILEPETPWKYAVKELAKKNSHGVPKEKIKEMLERYEKNVQIEDIIASVSDPKDNDLRNNSPVKTEAGLLTKSEWPESLPGNANITGIRPQAADIPKSTFLTTGDEDSGSFGTGNSWVIPSDESIAEITPKDGMGRSKIPEDVLPELQKYGNGESDVDDADVVIESYDDMVEVLDVTNGKSFKISDKTPSFFKEQAISGDKGKDLQHEIVQENSVNLGDMFNESPIKTQTEIDNTHHNVVAENVTDGQANDDLQDEEKIRLLLEEANMDADEHGEDWDDLVKNVTEEELNDERFNELVHDLGTSVRGELDKKNQGLCINNEAVKVSEGGEFADDSAMYELCSNMEDQLGRSLSSFIARPRSDETSSLFSIIDVDNTNTPRADNERKQTHEIPVTSESQTTGIFEVLSDKNDNVISKCDEPFIHPVTANNIDSNSSGVMQNDESLKSVTNDIVEEDFDKTHPLESKDNPCDTKEIITLCSSNVVNKAKNFNPNRNSISTKQSPDSLVSSSWDFGDVKEIAVESWEQKQDDGCEVDLTLPKPTRDRKRPSGDPQKWLSSDHEDSSVIDQNSCAWEPVPDGAVASWENTNTVNDVGDLRKLQSHTGAVPKVRKQDKKEAGTVISSRSNNSPSPRLGEVRKIASPVASKALFTNMNRSASDKNGSSVKETIENETQTLSIDFQALEMDNNLYELKILYGQPDYVPVDVSESMPLDNGPLTRGKLSLDKGTMTESSSDFPAVRPLRNLIAFFPKIPEPELRDVLEKCNFDLDWAMNVLLDGGYEMADSIEVHSEGSSEEFDDVENTVEDFNTNNNVSDMLMDVDAHEESVDIPSEEKNKRLKQSQTLESLASKREIENSFQFSESVDDRVTRLTGKDFEELNVHKVKQKKTKKKHGKKKRSEVSRETINWEEGEGAQFVTLVMDPLFASQLMSMFGPIGSCGMSGDMAPEDRSVILPLEFCHQIHQYWTKTLDGKFKHEGEVLDSLIREDENLARRLQQEEENLASENAKFEEDSTSLNNSDKAFLLDPPKNLQEIMDLEQALWVSQNDKSNGNGALISSQLSLQRLCGEYSHVDPEAVKQEFTESSFNYQDAVKRITSRYGSNPGVPKTVVAPEYIQQYELQIQRAKELSAAQQESEKEEYLQNDEIQPDNPQMYRDEAQLHYHQRQEFYRKAQDAYRKGMKNVAAYYAALGKLHAERLNEANKRASFKIIEAVNSKNQKKDANVLDLHLLHVPEALSATKAFLLEREQLLITRNINQLQVSLITGRGAHSAGGQAKLKPAIRDYLLKKGFTFHEGNSGMFVVTLQR